MNWVERLRDLARRIRAERYPGSTISMTFKPGWGHRARLVVDVHSNEFIEDSGWRNTHDRALDEIEQAVGYQKTQSAHEEDK